MSKRILLATFGSLGDLHPFLGLAVELKARGHHPVIASSESHRTRVEPEGITFAPMRPDPEGGADESAVMKRVMDIHIGPEVLIRELMMPHLTDTATDLTAAAAGVDLIVSHALTFPAPLIAQAKGIPWIATALAPMAFFSVYDWPVLGQMPMLSRLRPLGPQFHRPILAAAKRTIRPWTMPVAKLRADMGLPHTTLDPMFEGQFSPYLNLALFSPLLGQPQPDWPANTVVTGTPFYTSSRSGALSADLVAFLVDGPPPIVFTLGSAAVLTAEDFYRESALATRSIGRRALLLVGRDPRNRTGIPTGDDIGIFDYAPYALVFPCSAAIVHQGGVGTTGEALRSGRPMLVTPYAFDQPDNGARAARLGVARVLERKRYTATTAARELTSLLTHPAYAERAVEVGAKVRAEHGIRTAADAIERLLVTG